jgi:hypothetical protein
VSRSEIISDVFVGFKTVSTADREGGEYRCAFSGDAAAADRMILDIFMVVFPFPKER